jgi:hypothetical protein
MAEIKRAIEAFAFTGHDGVPRVITPGVLMSTDDPDYRGKESLFESVETAARPAKQAASDSSWRICRTGIGLPYRMFGATDETRETPVGRRA